MMAPFVRARHRILPLFVRQLRGRTGNMRTHSVPSAAMLTTKSIIIRTSSNYPRVLVLPHTAPTNVLTYTKALIPKPSLKTLISLSLTRTSPLWCTKVTAGLYAMVVSLETLV